MNEPLQLKYITAEYLAQFLPKNPIIIEAGAHKGRDALKFHAQWPESTLYCFEPVPHLFKQLKEATQHIPSIHCFNLALNDKKGAAVFYESVGKIDAASSLFEPDEYFKEKPIVFNQIEVNTITLDQWAQNQNVTHVDLMWLDLQGAELSALKGAISLLPCVKAIHTEVNLIERYKGAPLYDELKLWLESQGFYVAAEALYKITWGNALFLKK